MARCSTQLSRQLSQELDGYGLSNNFIEYRRILFNIFGYTVHEFCGIVTGSKRDALCSYFDAESDFDIIMVLPASWFDETKLHKAKSFITSDSSIVVPGFSLERGPKPGYCYIKFMSGNDDSYYFKQLLKNLTPFRGSTYISNTMGKDFLKEANIDDGNDYEVHGPALATVQDFDGIYFTADYVTAFHCPYLPTDYDEWCSRKRDHSWPPQWIIETTKKFGCLVVGVGHPASDTQTIEWRLSLNRTEYLLTKSFTNTQMKCYVLLRLVLKWLIQPNFQDPLSSYHVKTVMFWMCEEYEKQFWRHENLANCFMCSLIKLRTYVDNKKCPNYFLTNVNMLEGKLEGEIRDRVLKVLDSIIAEGPTVVYRCVPLNVDMSGAGCRHSSEESCTCLHKQLLQERLKEMADAVKESEATTTTTVNEFTYRACQFGLVDWHVVNEFHNQSITDSHTFSSLSVCEGMGFPNQVMYSLQKEYVANLRGNGSVARIKLATFFYHRRRFSYCLPLLSLVISSMESSQEFEVCKGNQASVRDDDEEIEGVECIYLTQNNKGFRVSEIVFGPCDKLLVPPDLQDAMRRPRTVNGTYYEGWVFVDSIVLAYYLLIVTLNAMRRYIGITSLFRRFHKVCTQQPDAIRIFRKDMAHRLYNHAFMLVWASTKGFTKLSS